MRLPESVAESASSKPDGSSKRADHRWRFWLLGDGREFSGLLLISVALLALLVWSDAGSSIGKRVYDRLELSLGFSASPQVVLVAVDEHSQRELGGWPISRLHYARLIERLVDEGQAPAALGFDLLFLNEREADATLALQMERLPVVLPAVLANTAAVGRGQAGDGPAQWQATPTVLAKAARATGHIHVRYESDGILRGIQTRLWGQLHFSLALIEAAALPGHAALTRAEYLRFPMVDPARPFVSYRLSDLLDLRQPLPALKGKIVLVGATDPLLGDYHATIYSGSAASGTPGVAILASAVNAHLSDRWVRVVPDGWVFASSLMVLLLVMRALQVCHPRRLRIMTLSMALSLPLASVGSLIAWGWWFDVVPIWLTLFVLSLIWVWLRLEGNLRYLKRKSRELQVGRPIRPHARKAFGILQLEQDLDWAIELQGRQLDLLHQMMEHLPEAMAVVDPSGTVVKVNARMQALGSGGLQPGIGLQSLAQELGLPADNWSDLVAVSAQADASLSVRSPSGQRSVYLKTTTFDAQGAQGLRLLMLLDVTELKQSQAQRNQALSFLSHDMRTPVASILALSRQIQTLQGSPQQCVTDARRVAGHAHQLMRLMDGFLFESMAQSEQLQLSQRLIDDLLDDAMAQVRDLASARSMQIGFDSGDRYFFVQVSTTLMVRAFMNLLLNAIKYGQRGTQISVVAEPADSTSVRITISNRIGDVVAEVDETILTQGFGLGLDFVRTVVRRHQGELQMNIDKASGLARACITLTGLMETE